MKSTEKKKILLVANTGWYLYNFRLPLARRLREERLEIVLVSPEDTYVGRLRAEGFEHIPLTKLSRRGLNPFKEFIALCELVRLYHREKPTAVHHFTIKCVLYGTIAAKLTGVRSVLNAVTGLGHIFIGKGLATSLARPLVRFLYSRILKARRGQVVFQNPDDLEMFMQAGLVAPEKTVIIRSSGVCTKKFRPRPGTPERPSAEFPNVLFAGRLIEEKGINDYVKAAEIVKKNHEACFQIAGERDPGNPSSVSLRTVKNWELAGVVDLLGHVENIDDVMGLASIVVLPSYREGTPRVLLEAAAMGLPVVATDVPGCREVVIDGHNGFLVPPRDPEALAEAINKLLNDKELANEMGLNGRTLIEKEFSVDYVVDQTLGLYGKMGLASGSAKKDSGKL